MKVLNILIIIIVSIIIINLIGFIIRYKLRTYMKNNISKKLDFDCIDNFLPFFKDVAIEYEFLLENSNKISEYKKFFLNFILGLFQTINYIFILIIFSFILLVTFCK